MTRDTYLCRVGKCDNGETVIVLHGTEDSAAGVLDYIQNTQAHALLGIAIFCRGRCIGTHRARDIDNETEVQGCASTGLLLVGDGLARGSHSNEQAFTRIFMKSDSEGNILTTRRGLIGRRGVRIDVHHCRFDKCRWSRRTRGVGNKRQACPTPAIYALQ